MSSGLFPAGPNATRFVGSVSSVASVAELVAIEGRKLEHIPRIHVEDRASVVEDDLLVGTALEVTVLGLCIYPTNT